MKNCSFIVILALLFSACASVPTKQYVKTGPSYDTRIANVKSVAVVADVCLMRDVSAGDKYWSIKDSQLSAQYMIESAKTFVTNKGYEVVFAEAPFVGSFKDKAGLMKFADEEGGPVREMIPPLFVAEGLANDPVYRQSLEKMFSAALSAVEQKKDPPSDLCCSKSDIKDALNVVTKKTGGNAILFLVGNGMIVPASKSIAQGVATSCISSCLTLGMFTYTKYDVSWFDTYTALVDAETGEILWSNSLRITGGGFTYKDYYSEKWPKNILFHMPSVVKPVVQAKINSELSQSASNNGTLTVRVSGFSKGDTVGFRVLPAGNNLRKVRQTKAEANGYITVDGSGNGSLIAADASNNPIMLSGSVHIMTLSIDMNHYHQPDSGEPMTYKEITIKGNTTVNISNGEIINGGRKIR